MPDVTVGATAAYLAVPFGSDGPWLHPGVELHKIKLLGLPKSEEALILGRNVFRLLGPKRASKSLKDVA